MDSTNSLRCADCDADFARRSRTGPIPKRCESCAARRLRSREKERRQANPESGRARTRKWQAANREHIKAYNRRAKMKQAYGITYEDFLALLERQGGVCAICATDAPRGKNWHVDHCHDTNAVRGILCGPCNTGLGHFRDDPDRLRKAIDYLTR